MRAAPPYRSFATFARLSDSFVLSVLCKRSYEWDARGNVTPAKEQPPLALDVERAKREDRNGEMLTQGRDVWPLKLATDVIVTGHAHAPRGVAVPEFEVGVSVGAQQRRIVALGPRFVERRGERLAFSPPEPIAALDVSWWNAYGGIDPMVLPRGVQDSPAFLGKPTLELFPGAYPRNPCGLGYLIADTPALVEGLALPQLEQVSERLRPESLLVRDARDWWRRPLPAGFGWCHALWFPRIVHSGGRPYHLPPAPERGAVLAEFALGLISERELTQADARFASVRMTSEAAPEMIFPFLKGDEPVRLEGFSPEGAQAFALPQERPSVRARVEGADLIEAGHYLHTLAIDTDARRFYLLHSTRFRVPDDLAADLSDGDPIDDILEQCEVSVGGQALSREEWPSATEEE
ncbi:MAG TPA: DUF2169 domain-containing protein [Polyangiaceae bacterium]|nr:DUF2169 domain-containing protein [Polyangiaceae bacterium]